MNPQRIVALYGQSIFITGIGIELLQQDDLLVTHLDGTCHEMLDQCRRLQPDILICDVHDWHLAFVLSLLRQQPGLVLFGLDTASNEVTVMSSQQFNVDTIDSLTDIIRQHRVLAEQ
jgi:hypothetical protein